MASSDALSAEEEDTPAFIPRGVSARASRDYAIEINFDNDAEDDDGDAIEIHFDDDADEDDDDNDYAGVPPQWLACVIDERSSQDMHVVETTTEDTRDPSEVRGDAFYEREELAAAARAYRVPVVSYDTKKNGAFSLVTAKKLSARAWLRLGLSLRALSEADEPRFAAGYDQHGSNVYLGADEPYEYTPDDEAACYRNGLRQAKPCWIALKVPLTGARRPVETRRSVGRSVGSFGSAASERGSALSRRAAAVAQTPRRASSVASSLPADDELTRPPPSTAVAPCAAAASGRPALPPRARLGGITQGQGHGRDRVPRVPQHRAALPRGAQQPRPAAHELEARRARGRGGVPPGAPTGEVVARRDRGAAAATLPRFVRRMSSRQGTPGDGAL